MICPKCKGRTEVLETVNRDKPVTRRRRRCTSCTHRFTTHELQIEKLSRQPGDPMELALKVRRLMGRKRCDPEAIAAAIAVDRRKAKIAREQRERDQDRGPYAEEHRAPRRLNRELLKRELGDV